MFTIEIEDGREANHYSSRTLQLKEISSQPSFNERMPLNPRKTIDLTKPGGAEPPSPPPPLTLSPALRGKIFLTLDLRIFIIFIYPSFWDILSLQRNIVLYFIDRPPGYYIYNRSARFKDSIKYYSSMYPSNISSENQKNMEY